MPKAKFKITVLDFDKIEGIKVLFNEVLDTLEALRLSNVSDDNRGHEISEAAKERTGYINRFADIIANEN